MTRQEEFVKDAPDIVIDNDRFCDFLDNEGFFTAPASTKYHGAYEGGLFDHSLCVYKNLKNITQRMELTWQRPESPFIIGMFHDLCKYDQYKKVFESVVEYQIGDNHMLVPEEKYHYEYNTDTLLKGHGSKSVMILSRFLSLTEEEMVCIRYHMGAYEKEEWAEFDKAIRMYPNTLWTHTADMLASKVDDV